MIKNIKRVARKNTRELIPRKGAGIGSRRVASRSRTVRVYEI
jgi:hypothetical protein